MVSRFELQSPESARDKRFSRIFFPTSNPRRQWDPVQIQLAPGFKGRVATHHLCHTWSPSATLSPQLSLLKSSLADLCSPLFPPPPRTPEPRNHPPSVESGSSPNDINTMGWIEKANRRIATGPIGRWFKLDGCGHVSAASNV